MHELSIAQSILDLVRPYVPEGGRVESVRLKVGEQSGVVAESLEFCWSAVVPGTPLADSHLVIEKSPFLIRCDACGAESESEGGLAVCPRCDSPRTRVTSGMELQVLDLELLEQPPVRA
jgi:hydrogenase nickel incorporation protein HypA/HybF